jgi:hypothetical protein
MEQQEVLERATTKAASLRALEKEASWLFVRTGMPRLLPRTNTHAEPSLLGHPLPRRNGDVSDFEPFRRRHEKCGVNVGQSPGGWSRHILLVLRP